MSLVVTKCKWIDYGEFIERFFANNGEAKLNLVYISDGELRALPYPSIFATPSAILAPSSALSESVFRPSIRTTNTKGGPFEG